MVLPLFWLRKRDAGCLFFVRRRSPKWFYIPALGVKEKKSPVLWRMYLVALIEKGVVGRMARPGKSAWYAAVLCGNAFPVLLVTRELPATTCKKIVNWIYIKNSSENPVVSSLLSMHRE